MKANIYTAILTAFVVLLMIGGASADGAVIGIGDGSGYTTVPITVTNGANVGSIHVNMTFDPSIVSVVSVSKGEMDSVMPNLEHVGDGYVQIIGYQTSHPGLNGDFNVAHVVFKSVSASGSCPVNLSVVTFKDSTPKGNVMAYTISNGVYTATADGGHGGGGGGGDGTYPPEPTPTDIYGNPIDTPTPVVIPTTSPVPSPTKNLPGVDGDDYEEKDLISLGKIFMAIVALLIAATAIVVKMKK